MESKDVVDIPHIRTLVWASNVDDLNEYFDIIDLSKLTSHQLIHILRLTSVYKNDIKRWLEFYNHTFDLLATLELDSAKELWGLDRGLIK